jgi:metallopeptidase MepB
MVPDKYKKPPQAPPLFTGTKQSIIEDAKKGCDRTRAMLDKLVAEETPKGAKSTFASVMGPQMEDENEVGLTAGILGFYQYVSGDAALRDSSTEAEKLMDDFAIECSMREDVFKLVEGVHNRKDSQTLDPESLRLLEKEYKAYIRNGLALPAGEKRDRFKEIKKRLSQLSIEFQKNLNEEDGGIWLTPNQLDGVSEDVVSGLEKGTGENEGKVKLSFKYPDLFPTLKFAVDPETRRQVFVNNENKVSPLICLRGSDGGIYEAYRGVD